MANETGYAIDSIRPYVAKGMLKKWLILVTRSSFRVQGIRNASAEEFRIAMTQKKA
jgi:hypothetical protein